MMPARRMAVLNAFVTGAVVGWNFWTARYGLGGRTVGGMSEVYDTLFTPAGYAFSIWGVIFLGLIANAAYQLWLAFRAAAPADAALAEHRATYIARQGPWLVLTNVANCLWTVLWLTERTAASVVVLASMFVFLARTMHQLGMARGHAPLEVRAFVWWPLSLYAGWVTVAVLANLSAFLAKHEVVSGTSAAWAIAMIALATLYNLAVALPRQLRAHVLVAVWALFAIAARQWNGAGSVKWTALAAAGVLLLALGAQAVRTQAVRRDLRAA